MMSGKSVNNGLMWGWVLGMTVLMVTWVGWAQEIGLSDAVSASSVVVRVRRARIKQAPNRKAKLRGVVVKGARLPILETAEGEGCSGTQWFRIYQEGWICGRDVRLSSEPPFALAQPVMTDNKVTPWPYAFVKEDTLEYRMSRHGWLEEVREVLPGFGFAVVKTRFVEGDPYFQTPEGKLIPKRAARISGRVSTFRGVVLKDGDGRPGWVVSRSAWRYRAPVVSKANRVGPIDRFEQFFVDDKIEVKKDGFVRTMGGDWLRERDVRVMTPATLPEEITGRQPWVDVDISNQVLTAYEGVTPVFATLVSTGRRGPSRTVLGHYRLWVKVAAIAMDNTDEEAEIAEDMPIDVPVAEPVERHLYSLQDVPWTQFFFENYAIHAVYWHNGFGARKSHGCVNMAPADAHWLYNWTTPRLPAGWWSIYATKADPGTLVSIRP